MLRVSTVAYASSLRFLPRKLKAYATLFVSNGPKTFTSQAALAARPESLRNDFLRSPVESSPSIVDRTSRYEWTEGLAPAFLQQ